MAIVAVLTNLTYLEIVLIRVLKVATFAVVSGDLKVHPERGYIISIVGTVAAKLYYEGNFRSVTVVQYP